MKSYIVKTVNRFTVAGTVHEFHVLPYSPAFKPAPVTKERTTWFVVTKKNIFYKPPTFKDFLVSVGIEAS